MSFKKIVAIILVACLVFTSELFVGQLNNSNLAYAEEISQYEELNNELVYFEIPVEEKVETTSSGQTVNQVTMDVELFVDILQYIEEQVCIHKMPM